MITNEVIELLCELGSESDEYIVVQMPKGLSSDIRQKADQSNLTLSEECYLMLAKSSNYIEKHCQEATLRDDCTELKIDWKKFLSNDTLLVNVKKD